MAGTWSDFKNDVIIVSQQAWDTEIGSNCKNIALQWSKTNRVLYLNSPLDRITSLKDNKVVKVKKRLNVINKKEDGLEQINENLWIYYPDCLIESVNWISVDFIFNIVNKMNNTKFAKSVNTALQRLGFKDFVLFNDSEIFKAFYLKEYLKPLLSVYYSRDYILAVDYWKKHGVKYEPILISKSDLCFTNSAFLEEYCLKYNKQSFYVGQGCDFEPFEDLDTQKSTDLSGIQATIIGYVGALVSNRLDIALIAYIASAFPDFIIALVGPEDEDFKKSNLHKIPNVKFVGQKPVASLPEYINAFDVCINPQLVNDMTIGNYPRKIDEYLALGKPVVATRTKGMKIFEDHVYLGETHQDYVVEIKRALAENSPKLIAERKAFALSHTWDNSVNAMTEKILTELENKSK